MVNSFISYLNHFMHFNMSSTSWDWMDSKAETII